MHGEVRWLFQSPLHIFALFMFSVGSKLGVWPLPLFSFSSSLKKKPQCPTVTHNLSGIWRVFDMLSSFISAICHFLFGAYGQRLINVTWGSKY